MNTLQDLSLKINRVWAMPNSNTFDIAPIKELIKRFYNKNSVDPFANKNRIAGITNDLNPEYSCDYSMDAIDFLKLIGTRSTDLVLYDPPFSKRQVVEIYKRFGIEVTNETTQSSWRRKHLDEISRILKPSGIVICFGWNSNGVGKKRGFDMIEILLVAHGAEHNDTIVTVERKIPTLFVNQINVTNF